MLFCLILKNPPKNPHNQRHFLVKSPPPLTPTPRNATLSTSHPSFATQIPAKTPISPKNGLIVWVTYAFLPNTEEFGQKPTQSTAFLGQIAPWARKTSPRPK
jgi:hypothetical protein